MFSEQQQRPAMRRKSSAQNFLSSFKSTSSSGSITPQSLNPTASLASNATNLPFSTTSPTVTPQAREWDAQSLHSDTVGSSMAGAQSPSSLTPGTSVEYLRDLVQKRIITLTYIRQIHEGRSHWFHTIMILPADLDREFNNSMPAIKKRTSRFAILGMSLSTLLDIHQPQDLLRGLLNVITEFEISKEEGENKSKMLSKFKTKSSKKGALGIAEYTGSYVDGSADTSYLLIPSIPFSLDYQQTLLSLLDVLSEVYNKIAKLLGPSPFHSAQHMMGPLGLLSPHPGVSYLFPSSSEGSPPTPYWPTSQNLQLQPNTHQSNLNQQQHQQPLSPSSFAGLSENEIGGSLWKIANGLNGSLTYSAGFSNPPMTNWVNSWDEMVLKIDGKLKKITSSLLKDLDTLARNGIKSELASLDPLLLGAGDELPGPGQGGAVYEFEGI